MKLAVILPAAGMGRRFSTGDPDRRSKLELPLPTGRSVLIEAIALFAGRPEVIQIIVAVSPNEVNGFDQRWGGQLSELGAVAVPGGQRERWETVLCAMDRVDSAATHIAVHDAARPLTSPSLIDRIFAATVEANAVIPATPVSSTLKAVNDQGFVQRTLPREGVVAVQTPQVFEAELLRRAYAPLANGEHDGQGVTDDASLVESLGEPVLVVQGEPTNLKITTPADAELAAAILFARGASYLGG